MPYQPIGGTVVVLEWVQTLRSGTSRDILSIDFGTSGVKLASASLSPRRLRLEWVDWEPVWGGKNVGRMERFDAALRKLVRRNELQAGQRILVALPMTSVIIRHLNLPNMSRTRLVKAVEYEAAHHLPVDLPDVRTEFHVVDRSDQTISLILFAVKEDRLRQFGEILRASCLNPEHVEITICSLFNLYRQYGPLSLPESVIGAPTALLDIGHATTDLAIVSQRQLQYARSLSVAGETMDKRVADQRGIDLEQARVWKEEEGSVPPSDNRSQSSPSDTQVPVSEGHEALRASIERLCQEIERTFEYHRSELRGEQIEQVVVCGGAGQVDQLPEYMEERIGLETMVFDPVHPGTPAEAPSVQRLLVNLGLLLRTTDFAEPLRINMLPRSFLEDRARFSHRRRQGVLAGLCLLALALVGLLGWFHHSRRLHDLRETQRQLRLLDPALERVRSVRGQLREYRERLRRIRALEQRHVPTFRILSRLAEGLRPALDRGLIVRAIHFSIDPESRRGRLKVRGSTRDFEDLSHVYRSLTSLPSVVSLRNEHQRKTVAAGVANTPGRVKFTVVANTTIPNASGNDR